MAKDKVFGAKVSNGKQFIAPGKSWLDYYYEDQEKRKKEEEQGKVRYTEAAKASRVQYSIPQYAGKSQNQGKTYQWERDLMQNEKIKGAGNSYTKKFDALTARMGMTEGQASEFRKYLDFQEDSQHVKPKMNKDKSINQSQSLKYARDAHLEVDVIDDMFKNMTKTNAARVKYDNELENQKTQEEAKKAKKPEIQQTNQAAPKEQKSNSFLDDILKIGKAGLQDALGLKTPAQASVDIAREYAEQGTTPTDTTQEISRGITRAANTFGLGTIKESAKNNEDQYYQDQVFNQREGGEKAADFVYDGLGYLGSGIGSYKAVSPAINKIFGDMATKKISETAGKELIKRLGVEAVRGGTAGAALTGAEVGVREGLNPEDQGWKENLAYVGLGAGIGAVADPLLGLGGKAISEGLGRFAKVDGELPSFSGNASDSILDSLAPTPLGNAARPSNELFDRLTRGANDEVAALENEINQRNTPFNVLQPKNVNNSQAPEEMLESLARPETNPAAPKRPSENELTAALFDANTRQEYEQAVKNYEDFYAAPKRPSEQEFIDTELAPFREAAEKQTQARQTWETVVKGAQKEAQRIKGYYGKIIPDGNSKDMINEIPPQFRGGKNGKGNDIYSFAEEEGFASADEAIAYLKQIDADSKTKLKDLTPEDNYVLSPEEWDVLETVARQKYNELHGAEKAATSPEEILEDLVPTGNKTEQVDNLLMSLDGTMNRPKSETEAINPAPASGDNVAAGEEFDPLVRLNIQQHAPGTGGPKLISDGPMTSEKAITKFTDKAYENYVNSNHSAKVAEVKVLENAAKQAKAEGRVKKAAQLEKQAKSVKKHGSDFEKAVGNEKASAAASSNFLKRHFKALSSTVKNDEEMAQFLNYQMAMDLNWRRNNGLGEYELPENVDWGDINALVQEATSNTKFGAFNAEMRNLTQEWRDVMLEYGLINKDAHAKLSNNPHYMYLGKDLTHQMDNIDKGTDFRSVSDKRASGPNIVHSQTGGDAKSLFQNPIDNLVNNTFSVFKNSYKEETGRQALRMAKLDKDSLFFKEISEKGYNSGGGIKVANGGKPRYVRMQDDLMRMIKENDEGLDMNVMTQLTSAFAGLKTRSLEYQTAALIRDTGTSMVASQIKNPIRYFKEYAKSLKNGSADAKKIGGYFDKAHNAQTAGLDPKKVLKEFQRQHGSVKSFDLKKPGDWKELANTVGRILDTPFKYTSKLLGQVSDEIPRDIEVRETERLFMKQHGKKIEAIQSKIADIDNQLAQAQNAPDFSPQTQGIDKLAGQKEKLEKMLGDINRDLKREQIYRSRDVINYSRAGRGDIAKGIRKYVVFANTTTQSKDKMIRSFIERPGSTLVKAATAMAPLVAAQKVMFDKLDGEDKDVYERVPAYIKLNNFVFVDKGNVYTVPKIQELALVTNPLEAILHGEKLNDSMKHLTKESVPYQGGNIAQALVPDEEGNTLFDRNPYTKVPMGATLPTMAVTPGIDVLANDKLGFNRKPISYKADEANKWTPEVIKNIVGDNPNSDAADYLVRQLLGDYGKYAVYGADAAADPSKKKVDELIRNLNPLQDRIYDKDGYKNILGLKVPFKEPILDKKKE